MRKIRPLRLSEFLGQISFRAEHDAAAELGHLHWVLRHSSCWGTRWSSDPYFHSHNKSLATCPLLLQAQHCFQSLGQCWCWWQHVAVELGWGTVEIARVAGVVVIS